MSDPTTTTTAAEETETGGRPVVVAEFVTLDGHIVGPDEDMSWVAVGFDPQMQEDIAEDMGSRYDLFVFGRVTFDIFAAYWPHAVPYGDGDALKPAEGKEDPRIIRASTSSPSWCSPPLSATLPGPTPGSSPTVSRTRSAGSSARRARRSASRAAPASSPP